jgi:hypothetical protein
MGGLCAARERFGICSWYESVLADEVRFVGLPERGDGRCTAKADF